MELEKLARELGAAIQKDQVYLDYEAARKANDEDEELNALMGKIRLVQLSYQQEAAKESPEEQKMQAFYVEFIGVFNEFMAFANMLAFYLARFAVDEMMNFLTGILAMCVNGEDPATCDPTAHNCGGECSSCSGCH